MKKYKASVLKISPQTESLFTARKRLSHCSTDKPGTQGCFMVNILPSLEGRRLCPRGHCSERSENSPWGENRGHSRTGRQRPWSPLQCTRGRASGPGGTPGSLSCLLRVTEASATVCLFANGGRGWDSQENAAALAFGCTPVLGPQDEVLLADSDCCKISPVTGPNEAAGMMSCGAPGPAAGGHLPDRRGWGTQSIPGVGRDCRPSVSRDP